MVGKKSLLRILAAADEADPEDVAIRAAIVALLAVGEEDYAGVTERDMSPVGDDIGRGIDRRPATRPGQGRSMARRRGLARRRIADSARRRRDGRRQPCCDQPRAVAQIALL